MSTRSRKYAMTDHRHCHERPGCRSSVLESSLGSDHVRKAQRRVANDIDR